MKFSLLWGLACLLILKVVHPGIARMISLIPPLVSPYQDHVLSVRKLNAHLEQLERLSTRIRAASDGIGEKVSDATLALMAKQAMLLSHIKGDEKRLLRAFPGMRSLRHPEWLEKLKEQLMKK